MWTSGPGKVQYDKKIQQQKLMRYYGLEALWADSYHRDTCMWNRKTDRLNHRLHRDELRGRVREQEQGAVEEEEEEEAVVNLAKKWSGWKPKDEKERMKFRQRVLRAEDVTRRDVKSAGCDDDMEKVKNKGCGHSEDDDEELQEGKDVGSAR